MIDKQTGKTATGSRKICQKALLFIHWDVDEGMTFREKDTPKIVTQETGYGFGNGQTFQIASTIFRQWHWSDLGETGLFYPMSEDNVGCPIGK